jgi:hypothetical protein
MRSRFRPSPAMIVACIALFVALGGTATAVTYVVSSNSQIGPGTVSGHKPPTGKHSNVIAGSINGKDIADRSVDTCPTPLTIKRGAICAGSSGSKNWREAIDYCSSYGLRLPSFSEAQALARNYDVPGVPPASQNGGPYFWTDEFWQDPSASGRSYGVDENGGTLTDFTSDSNITVCVTDPSA